MPTVINVQFRPVTKLYHFSPGPLLDLTVDDYVIVETSRGQEVAQVVAPPHMIDESEVVGEIKPVARRATAWDLVQKDRWERKEQEALAVCRDKARASSLDIKIVRCEYSFDGGRLLVYFSSEQRVDFRDLVRDLARIFHTRIEMRQIGVRDEAKLLDGVGKCGRQLCCTSWLREFTPVSIRMAKNQQLPLNPDEISGVCGRLLCCLSYENAHYREQNKKMPKMGAEVITPQGVGRVRHIHPLKETVTVLLQSSVLSEFAVADLITSKSAAGAGCSTCGGCTVKRRASAEQDNARARRAASGEPDAGASESDATGSAKRRRSRRRRRPRKGGED
ncbi:MAG: stage 0 sporulation family protein [Chloroflexota bacterium]|jgi:cell fate regulator YaaT (PSP1 superfamily)|nr:stage 0 sporulation family protein [Chloroflexota bacterium]